MDNCLRDMCVFDQGDHVVFDELVAAGFSMIYLGKDSYTDPVYKTVIRYHLPLNSYRKGGHKGFI